MLENSLAAYGSEYPEKLMDKFYEAGNDVILNLRNVVNSPENRKKPRTWGGIEAARMVGVSDPTFRKMVEKHNLPGVISESVTKTRIINKFTLEAINTLRDIAGTRYKRPIGSDPLIVSVSNLKGGVGKTETAVDLAKKCSIEGLRVLLLDLDAQGTATLISCGLIPDLEIKYEETLTNSLLINPDEIINIILKTHFDGLHIIPANLAIQDCDLLLPNPKENNSSTLGSPHFRLTNALKKVKNNYDVIIIDCSPNLGMLTLNAIIASDGMIIPIPPSMNDYSSFVMYTATLRNLFKSLPNKKLEYLRILISKHSGNKEADQMHAMMKEQFGRYMLTNYMCETVEVLRAASNIGTIYDVSKPGKTKEAYERALHYLDGVNMEIISHFKAIWDRQSIPSKSIVSGDLAHG
jgi:chromosome partitioning protein